MSDETPASQSSEPAANTNVSGGLNLDSQGSTSVGGDATGRDKISITNNYYYGTTPPPQPTPTGPVKDAPLPQPTRTPVNAAGTRIDQLMLVADYWVTIPAGNFWLGSDRQIDRAAKDSELPRHSVYVPQFRIARVPVTVELFDRFVQATHYKTTAELRGGARSLVQGLTRDEWPVKPGAYWAHPQGSDSFAQSSHPVTCISWHDALEFCLWAGARLPTEAEWEKAAAWDHATQTKRIYPWGNDLPTANLCNFNLNAPDTQTTPVGQYSPRGDSAYGVADMAGNVWEWTSSLYRPYRYEVDAREDPQAPGERVLRGGSFYQAAAYVRCAYRNYHHPDAVVSDYGFRVCAVD